MLSVAHGHEELDFRNNVKGQPVFADLGTSLILCDFGLLPRLLPRLVASLRICKILQACLDPPSQLEL